MLTFVQIYHEARSKRWPHKRLGPGQEVRAVQLQIPGGSEHPDVGITLRLRDDRDWDAHETGHGYAGIVSDIPSLHRRIVQVRKAHTKRMARCGTALVNPLRELKPEDPTDDLRTREDKIRAYLADWGAMWIPHIVEDVGYNYDQVRHALHRLGAVLRVRGGKAMWKLPEDAA